MSSAYASIFAKKPPMLHPTFDVKYHYIST